VLTAVAAGDGAAASAAAPVSGGGAGGSSARADPAKALAASTPHDASTNEKR
jgi:hypothetical protein